MEDFGGDTAYALYGNFAVGPEADGFRLTVSGYSGTAGSLWNCPWAILAQSHMRARIGLWLHGSLGLDQFSITSPSIYHKATATAYFTKI